AFTISWQASHHHPPAMPEPEAALEATEQFWREWVDQCTYHGPYRDAVVRSLITLKALTYSPTGGIVAAPTTSLPEEIGGVGNWAAHQMQLDVYGEVSEALHLAHMTGLARNDYASLLQLKLIQYLEDHWHEPDEGIWEVRGPRRHFVHSKVMAWVAVDRTVK